MQRYNIQLFEEKNCRNSRVNCQNKKNLYLVEGFQIQNIMNGHFLAYTNIQTHTSALL